MSSSFRLSSSGSRNDASPSDAYSPSKTQQARTNYFTSPSKPKTLKGTKVTDANLKRKSEQVVGWARKPHGRLPQLLQQAHGVARREFEQTASGIVDSANAELNASNGTNLSTSTEEIRGPPALVMPPARQEQSAQGDDAPEDDTPSPTARVGSSSESTDDERERPSKYLRLDLECTQLVYDEGSDSAAGDTLSYAADSPSVPDFPDLPIQEGHPLITSELTENDGEPSKLCVLDVKAYAESCAVFPSSSPQAKTHSSPSARAHCRHLRILRYANSPPSINELLGTVYAKTGRSKVYRRPYYSAPGDVPPRAREFAGRTFRIPGDTIRSLGDFSAEAPVDLQLVPGSTPDVFGRMKPLTPDVPRGWRCWSYASDPPSRLAIATWLVEQMSKSSMSCRAEPPPPHSGATGLQLTLASNRA